MKRLLGLGAVLAVLACAAPRMATAHEVPGQDALRQEVIANMMDAGEKVIELAEAIPDKKYSWRPSKGVRSANEVFLHVIGANYMFPNLLGSPGDKTMEELMQLERSSPGKAKILEMLKDSYAVASKAIAGVSDEQLDTKVDFFGNMVTRRAVMMMLAAHSHEHLGQVIAYARVNGIVPPWTARQMEAAKKAAAEKKAGGGN